MLCSVAGWKYVLLSCVVATNGLLLNPRSLLWATGSRSSTWGNPSRCPNASSSDTPASPTRSRASRCQVIPPPRLSKLFFFFLIDSLNYHECLSYQQLVAVQKNTTVFWQIVQVDGETLARCARPRVRSLSRLCTTWKVIMHLVSTPHPCSVHLSPIWL